MGTDKYYQDWSLPQLLQLLCTEQLFWTRKQPLMFPAEASGTVSASQDKDKSSQGRSSEATSSRVLRENRGNGVRLPFPPAIGRARTASILRSSPEGLNMGD